MGKNETLNEKLRICFETSKTFQVGFGVISKQIELGSEYPLLKKVTVTSRTAKLCTEARSAFVTWINVLVQVFAGLV